MKLYLLNMNATMMRIRLLLLIFVLSSAAAWGQQVRLLSSKVKVDLDNQGFFSSIKVGEEDVLQDKRYFPLLTAHTYQAVYPASVARHGNTLECVMDDGGQVLLGITEADGISLVVLKCPAEYKFLSFGPVGLIRNKSHLLDVAPQNIKTQFGLPLLMMDEARKRYFLHASNDMLRNDRYSEGEFTLLMAHAANMLGSNGMAYAGPVVDCRMAWIDQVAGLDGAIEGAKVSFHQHEQSHQQDWSEYVIDKVDAKDFEGFIARHPCKVFIHDDAFESYGHYVLKDNLAAGDEALKSLVASAAKRGVKFGVRIAGNHISSNDAYVTPKPSQHLLRQLQFVLLESADSAAATLQVLTGRGSCFSTDMPSKNLIKLGNELIAYQQIDEYDEVIFLDGCSRGALGTQASAHKANDLGVRYWVCPNGHLMADCQLQDSIADRIVDMVNHTGMEVLLLDNLQDFSYTGHADYDAARFIRRIKAGFNHPVELVGCLQLRDQDGTLGERVLFPVDDNLENLRSLGEER